MQLDSQYNFTIKLIAIAISSLFILNIQAQSEAEFLKLANENYNRQDYFEAFKYYKSAWKKIDKDKQYLLQAGISGYKVNELDFAIHCFEKLIDIGDPLDKTTNWNLAKCHQHKNEFEEAIICYKRYLKTAKNKDPQKAFIKNELLRCEEGIKYKRKSPLAIVESIGPNINTKQDEFAPIPNIRQNGSYFISAIRNDNQGGKRDSEGFSDGLKGRLRSDIFLMKQTNGSWSLSKPTESELNSNMDDSVLGYLDSGNVLMFYRTWNDQKGSILLDTLNNKEVKLNYTPYISPMIAEIGDHAVSIFQDSLMIFSSCRTGGYGGYDLYLSVMRNGVWSPAINLGAKVNSSFNEDFPFLSKDGLTLYFSSDNLKSMGGYDIFKTKYLPEAQQWSSPQNLGIPINSSGNDIYFKLSNDGLAGIFSSDRKINNLGGQDIYLAYFKEDLTEQLNESNGSALTYILDPEPSNPEINSFKDDVSLSKNLQKEELKNYFIEPVYYTEEDFVHEPKTQKILDKLVAMMQLQIDLKIQFIGHSYEESQDPINLYYSIKKSEELEKYLIEKKIAKSRINCIGLGSSLPIAKAKINGNKSLVSEKLNKRIEINILKPDTTAVRINYANIPIAENMKSDKSLPFRVLRSGVTYSLYLGESSSVLNHPMIHFSEGLVFVEKNASQDSYHYYFGLYTFFRDAEAALNKFQAQYKTDLDIKAFNSGKTITRTEIIDHVLQDADLLLYLNYLNAKEKNKK